jgi:pimeloyl-ACP methyl ester carboxylesterase
MRVFTSKDGTPIACFVSGSGPPLVLVHGTAADHTRWMPVLPALEAHHTVHACDRRGRGASGDNADYAIEREAEDVAAVVDGIGGPVDLLGHSYGAICALEAATRAKNIRHLVLYEPPIPTGAPISPPGVVERLQAKLDAGDREGAVVDFHIEVPRMSKEQVAKMRELPAWQASVGAAHTLLRELRGCDEYVFVPERFKRVTAPTLLLYGDASPGFFRAATEMVHDAIPSSKIVVMAGQQHTAMDTATELFARDVLDFLEDR